MISKAPREAVDLSHHLNSVSRGRFPSPLKDIIKYMAIDGMVSLAGGLPHPSLFPFTDLNVSVQTQQSLSPSSTAAVPSPEILHVPSQSTDAHRMSLSTAMQYGSGHGDVTLRTWAAEFTRTLLNPAYDNWEILLNAGNTDGWGKVVRLLCEPGDFILCEEHTYPSAQAVWAPMGCKAAPIAMDGRVMRADALDRMLSEWSTERGKKPHLLYLVPVGSNPTGSTMDGERKKDIYDVCVKHDIVICEDDPYYFFQFPA